MNPVPGCLPPDRVARDRPYVSLAPPPPPARARGRGDYLTEYDTTRAPIIRARVWMFYRDQARTP